MLHVPNTIFLFLVDTNDYAGNFEREMVAFMTGRVGECGAGEKQAEQAEQALELHPDEQDWLETYVTSGPDDHGCSRPASIWASPDDQMNTVALLLGAAPPANVVAFLKQRAALFTNDTPGRALEVVGFRLVVLRTTRQNLVLA